MPQYTLLNLNIKQDSSVAELERLFPGVQDVVNGLLGTISSSLEKDALGAFQTTVPVYTLQLRNSMILSKGKGAKGFNMYVSGAKHTNTVGRKKLSGGELARILDEGTSEKNGMPLHRRKNAVPAFNKLNGLMAPGAKESTANWIGNAFDAFDRSLEKFD